MKQDKNARVLFACHCLPLVDVEQEIMATNELKRSVRVRAVASSMEKNCS